MPVMPGGRWAIGDEPGWPLWRSTPGAYISFVVCLISYCTGLAFGREEIIMPFDMRKGDKVRWLGTRTPLLIAWSTGDEAFPHAYDV